MTKCFWEVRVPGESGTWHTFTTVSRHRTLGTASRACTKLQDKLRKEGKEPKVVIAHYNKEKPSGWCAVTDDERTIIWWD